MLKFVPLDPPMDGRNPVTPSEPHAPNSTSRLSPFQEAAAKATDDLFRFCEPLDVGEPEAFLAAVIGIFLEFPIEVMKLVSDPVRGLPSRVRRPHLTDIRKACEEAYAPIARQLKRERVAVDRKLLAPPAAVPKMTLAEMEAKAGRPLFNLRRMNDAGRRFKSVDEATAESDRIADEKRRADLESLSRQSEGEMPEGPEAA